MQQPTNQPGYSQLFTHHSNRQSSYPCLISQRSTSHFPIFPVQGLFLPFALRPFVFAQGPLPLHRFSVSLFLIVCKVVSHSPPLDFAQGPVSPSYHHITTSSHHHIISSSHHHITTSPHHHIITSPHHHITTSPHHHIITSSHHHITTSSHHHITTSSHHLISTSSHQHIITSPHSQLITYHS